MAVDPSRRCLSGAGMSLHLAFRLRLLIRSFNNLVKALVRLKVYNILDSFMIDMSND